MWVGNGFAKMGQERHLGFGSRNERFITGYNRSVSNYIDNSKFEELIQEFKLGNKDNESELFSMFDLLIDRLMISFKFNVDRDEAKQECFLLILKVLKNFNRESGQAFNYFTTVILNNLRLIYTKNKKYQEKMEAYKNFKADRYQPQNPSSLEF